MIDLRQASSMRDVLRKIDIKSLDSIFGVFRANIASTDSATINIIYCDSCLIVTENSIITIATIATITTDEILYSILRLSRIGDARPTLIGFL